MFFALIRRCHGGALLDRIEIFLLAGGGFGAQPIERLCARGDRHQLIGAPLRQRALAPDDVGPFGLIAVGAKPLQMDSDIAVDRLASSGVPGGARQRQHRGDGDHVVAVGGAQMIVGRLGLRLGRLCRLRGHLLAPAAGIGALQRTGTVMLRQPEQRTGARDDRLAVGNGELGCRYDVVMTQVLRLCARRLRIDARRVGGRNGHRCIRGQRRKPNANRQISEAKKSAICRDLPLGARRGHASTARNPGVSL